MAAWIADRSETSRLSRGKHLSLSEARKLGQVDQFAKEHPAPAGSMKKFDKLLGAMATGGPPSSAAQTPKAKAKTSDGPKSGG